MTRYNICEYDVSNDGETTETATIQELLDVCAEDGGGVVVIPTGEYVTGPLTLRSNVEVHLEPGATLLGEETIERYPTIQGRSGGIEQEVYASLFTGHDLENVAITGQGTIDARGHRWWEAQRQTQRLFDERGFSREEYYPSPDEAALEYPRPFVIDLYRCEDVLVRDVTIQNSPSWTVHPVYCESVTIDNVSIRNPEESPNTDGINPDSCRNVRISNCHIDVGDDCITIKSGYDENGRRVGKPCENVVVTNCTMIHGHGGVVIGSEMSGDVRNVTVSNCVFDRTDNGLRIKTERGRGGVVENIRATNIVMRNLSNTAFIVTMFYYEGEDETQPVTERTPTLRDIHYSDITIDGTVTTATIRGLSEMPVENFSLSNVWAKDAECGITVTNVDDMSLQDVTVDAQTTPAFDIRRTTSLKLTNTADPDPNPDTPIVRLDGVNAIVQSCTAAAETGTFLEYGDGDEIIVQNNHLDATDTDIVIRE